LCADQGSNPGTGLPKHRDGFSVAINHSATILSIWTSRTIQSLHVLIAEAGSQDMQQRACAKWKSLLKEHYY
jgi:hypothetical protein